MTIISGHKDIKSLIIGDLAQFHIPIYQRTYTWDARGQVDKLIDDIVEFDREYRGDTKAEYYIGNVIVKNQIRAFQEERVVIDGQQRITTTILILCAIRDIFLQKNGSAEAKQIARSIGKALSSNDDGVVKIKLNNMEHQNTLVTLLTGELDLITPADKKTRYWENYLHIFKRLEKMTTDEFEGFINILNRVKVVIIFLDEAQDENSVFESINSLGKPLSGSDLIKNYLFSFKNYQCSHGQEKFLTDLYTKNLESIFAGEKNIEYELETFFREYVAIKTADLPNKDPKIIYYSFKKMVGEINSYEECRGIILDIAKWGVIYQTLRVGEHSDIDRNHLEYIRTSFLTYATLLMDIVDKTSRVENGILIVENKDELNKALKKVVCYDVCRLLGGFPAKQITRFIPTIPKRLSKSNSEYYLNYSECFESLVTSATEGFAQPSMTQLKRAVVDVDLYNRVKKQVLKFFVLIENINSNEILSFERDLKGCQIEHIMPQTLPSEGWEISKENHERYLHTLGNLSITFDNQSLGNKSFDEKREILVKKSRIRLNQMLMNCKVFNDQSIRDRSLSLLQIFADEYGVPDFAEKPRNDDVNIFDADDPTHKKLEYAIFNGARLEISEISKLYAEVLRSLYKTNEAELLSVNLAEQIKLTDNPNQSGIINPVPISESMFVEGCYNNKDKFKKIKTILSELGMEDKLRIKYAETPSADDLLAELSEL